jgi:hypothetical protein
LSLGIVRVLLYCQHNTNKKSNFVESDTSGSEILTAILFNPPTFIGQRPHYQFQLPSVENGLVIDIAFIVGLAI